MLCVFVSHTKETTNRKQQYTYLSEPELWKALGIALGLSVFIN